MGELVLPEGEPVLTADPLVGLLGEEGLPEELERADAASSPPSIVVQEDDGDAGDSSGCGSRCSAGGGALTSTSILIVGGDDNDELAVQASWERVGASSSVVGLMQWTFGIMVVPTLVWS